MNHIVRWTVAHPIATRILAAVLLIVVFVLLAAQPAFAAGTDDGTGGPLDGVTDSHGIPFEQYTTLPYNRGDLLHLDLLANQWWIDRAWEVVLFGLSWSVSMLDWTLSFEWVDIISAPAKLVGNAIEAAVGDLHWMEFAMIIAGSVCVFFMIRGRWATGLANLLISCAFALAATGILANPVQSVVGENGLMDHAANAGGEIAVRITTDGDAPAPGATVSDLLDESVNQQLVDIFVRVPAQLVSFGKVLEGECVKVFDEAMKNAPTRDAGDKSVRDAVGACDAEAKSFIEHPSGQLVNLWVIQLSMLFLLGIAVAASALFFFVVILAAYKAIAMGIQVLGAMLPTADRSGIWFTMFDVLMRAAFIVLGVIFLAAYLRLIIWVMKAATDAGMGIEQFFMVDIAFIAGTILLFKIRTKLKTFGKKWAERMARLGFGESAGPRKEAAINPLRAAQSIARTVADVKMISAKLPTRGPRRVRAAKSVGELAAEPISAPGLRALPPGANGPLALPAGSGGPAPTPSGGSRARAIAAGGVKAVATVASWTPTPLGAAAKSALAVGNVAGAAKRSLPAHSRSANPGTHGALDTLKASAGGTRPPRGLPAAPTRPGSEVSRVRPPYTRVVGSNVGPQGPAAPIRTDRNQRVRATITSLRAHSGSSS